LKKALESWLPGQILHRKKRGFGAPMGSWIRHDLSPLLDDLLSESQVKWRGLFDWMPIRQMILRHKAQNSDYTDQLLALVNLELWCQVFLDGGSTRPLELTSTVAYTK